MGLKLSDLSQLLTFNDSDTFYIVSSGVSYYGLLADLKTYIGQASISGTASYIPVFTGSDTAGNSIMRQLNSLIGIGLAPNEILTVGGVISLAHSTAPNATTGYGKLYVKTDGKLYFKNASGSETDLLLGGSGGSGVTSRYASVTAMIADQAAQVNQGIYFVTDDENSPSGYAYYEYLGTSVGDITDYRLIASENGSNVDISTKADKATGHTTGNLAELDSDGNAVDSGEASEFLDIYNDVPADVKTYLETDSNWLSGTNYLDQITVTGFANDGETGMRFKDTEFFYECLSDGIGAVWTRYPVASAYFNPFGIPESEKTKLEDSANWTGTSYTGTSLVNCPIGSEHFDATYYYKFIDNNIPLRLTRS